MKLRYAIGFLCGFTLASVTTLTIFMLSYQLGAGLSLWVTALVAVGAGLFVGTSFVRSDSSYGELRRGLTIASVGLFVFLIVLAKLLPSLNRAYCWLCGATAWASSHEAIKVLFVALWLFIPSELLGMCLKLTTSNMAERTSRMGGLLLPLAGITTAGALTFPFMLAHLSLSHILLILAGLWGLSAALSTRYQDITQPKQPTEESLILSEKIEPVEVPLTLLVICGCAAYSFLWYNLITSSGSMTFIAWSAAVFGFSLGSTIGLGVAHKTPPNLRSTTYLLMLCFSLGLGVAAGLGNEVAIALLDKIRSSTSIIAPHVGLVMIGTLPPGLIAGIATGLVVLRNGSGGRFDITLALPIAGLITGLILGYLVLAISTFQFGLKLTVLICACASWIGASLVPRRRRLRSLIVASLVLVATAVIVIRQPHWDKLTLAVTPRLPKELTTHLPNLSTSTDDEDIKLCRVTPDGTVMVAKTIDGTFLTLDHTRIGSSQDGEIAGILTAQIALILNADAKDALVIGMGDGIAAGNLAASGIEVDCLEPSRALAEAASFFSAYNHDVLHHLRQLINDDPLTYLLTLNKQYDIIIINRWQRPAPTVPAAVSRESIMLMRGRLQHSGLICVRIDLPFTSGATLRYVISNLASCFPYLSAWQVSPYEILLVGSMREILLRKHRFNYLVERSAGTGDLKKVNMNSFVAIASTYITDRTGLVAFASKETQRTTPLRTLIYETGMTTGEELAKTFKTLYAWQKNVADLLHGIDRDSPDFALLKNDIDLCSRGTEAMATSVTALLQGRYHAVSRSLEESFSICRRNGLVERFLSDFYVFVSRSLALEGRTDEAIKVAKRSIEIRKTSPRAFYNLAQLVFGTDTDLALRLLNEAIALDPSYTHAYLLKAHIQTEIGDYEEAGQTLTKVLSIDPFNTKVHLVRGICFIRRNLLDAAITELERALESKPNDLEATSALGYVFLLKGNLDQAEKYYRRALEINPDHIESLNNYATVLAERGEYRKAIQIWEKALRLDPSRTTIRQNIEDARRKLEED